MFDEEYIDKWFDVRMYLYKKKVGVVYQTKWKMMKQLDVIIHCNIVEIKF